VDVRDGDESVEVGFESIDQEHRFQIGLIDAMQDAVRQGGDGREVAEILENLLEFSKAHFLAEQLLMRLHAYPAYEAHVQDHDRMTEVMLGLKDAFREGRVEFSVSVMDSLRGDLIAHIRGKDRHLGEFLAKSEMKNPEG
jgi:hemerythrin-like metal-binding protein